MIDAAAGTQLFSFLHAAHTIETRVEARLAIVGLSLSKLAALHHLTLTGNSLPLGQLAERLSCVKSNVTQLVDRLEADGLVERTLDPGDRRSRLAVITEAGQRAFEEGSRLQQEAERTVFASLSRDESAQLAALISKLDRA